MNLFDAPVTNALHCVASRRVMLLSIVLPFLSHTPPGDMTEGLLENFCVSEGKT